MRRAQVVRLFLVVPFGGGLAFAGGTAAHSSSTRSATSTRSISSYCSVAQSEFGGPTRVLNFDVTTTPFTIGAAAISDLQTSLLRTKPVAPLDVIPTYNSSLAALRSTGNAWRTMKTARNESRRTSARIRFTQSNATLRLETDKLRVQVARACATFRVASPPAAPPVQVAPVKAPPLPAAPAPVPSTPAPSTPVPSTPVPTVAVVAVPVTPNPPPQASPGAAATPVAATAVTPVLISPVPVSPAPAPQPPSPQPGPQPSPPPSPPPSGNAASWLAFVNQARAQSRACGTTVFAAAQPLAWDTRLEDTARGHSAYQAQIGQLTHTGTGGSQAGQRITTAGFTWSYWGENIGWNYPNAASMLQGWLTSPAHCSQIMDSRFTHVGWANVSGYDTMNLGRVA